MGTPFIKELGLYARNNEAVDEVFDIVEEISGVDRPVDITGMTFKAQARKQKGTNSPLMCDIEVSIYGDPANGQIRVYVPEDVIKAIPPWKGFWDLLAKNDTSYVDNLFMAPFEIDQGVSVWTPGQN